MYSRYVTALTSLIRGGVATAGGAAERKDREPEAAEAPTAEESPLDEFLGNRDLFGIVREYADPASLELLRQASQTAGRRLLEAPRELLLSPSGATDVHEAALPYARLLLSKPYVKTFLTQSLFPTERFVMRWVYEDRDVVALLDRSLPRVHPFYEWQQWHRCMSRFMETCVPRIAALRRSLESLYFGMDGEEPVKILSTRVTDNYDDIIEIFRNLFALHGADYWELYRSIFHNRNRHSDARKTSASEWPILHPRRIPDLRLGDSAAEWEFEELFLNAKETSFAGQYYPLLSFEHFVRVVIPALFRHFRAAVVFLHAWFPFTDVLKKKVYNLSPRQFPRDLYEMGENSFNPNGALRVIQRAEWKFAHNGARVFPNEAAMLNDWYISRKIKRQFFLFEAYEFSVAFSCENETCKVDDIWGRLFVPTHRLTATAIVDVARSLCIEPKFYRLQRELTRVESRPAEAQAVREKARALFASDAMFLPEDYENGVDDRSTSSSSSSSSAARGTQRAPAFDRDAHVLQSLEDALRRVRARTFRPASGARISTRERSL